MSNHDHYYGSSGQANYGYTTAQSPPKAYSPEDIHKPLPNRPVSPLNAHDADPYASHSTLHTPSSQAPPPSFHRQESDPYQSSDQIPLQSHQPKSERSRGPYPPGQGFQRQDSDSYLIAQEEARSYPSKKKRSFDWSRIPWVVYTVTIIQICVFIAELVKMSSLTGSPIMTKPYVNPMIGPSPNVLINMGARYVACMRNQAGVQNETVTQFPCPNATDTSANCSLQELCGFTGSYPVPNPNPNLSGPAGLDQQPEPNQWFRFIVPIFLHGGFIHIASNLLLQLMIARDMEKAIGSIRFALVYFSAGIFGFVFGGSYAQSGIASTGCSGSLFGIIGLVFLDLFYTWGDRDSPWFDLVTLVVTVVIEIVIGLLPTGLDNFSHIGGLIVGLVLGVCLLHSPNSLRKHIGTDPISYNRSKKARRKSQPIGSTMVVYGTTGTDATGFLKDPKNFFQDRKPLWWVWWVFRVVALLAIVIAFILITKNFYETHESNCSWCQYMSCIDHDNWCQKYNLAHPTTSTVPAATSGPARLML